MTVQFPLAAAPEVIIDQDGDALLANYAEFLQQDAQLTSLAKSLEERVQSVRSRVGQTFIDAANNPDTYSIESSGFVSIAHEIQATQAAALRIAVEGIEAERRKHPDINAKSLIGQLVEVTLLPARPDVNVTNTDGSIPNRAPHTLRGPLAELSLDRDGGYMDIIHIGRLTSRIRRINRLVSTEDFEPNVRLSFANRFTY